MSVFWVDSRQPMWVDGQQTKIRVWFQIDCLSTIYTVGTLGVDFEVKLE
jgi:hypothetical protein